MSEQHASSAAASSPPIRLARVPIVLSDFTDHLVWPRLLRAAGLALAPHRIGLAAVGLVLVFLLDELWRVAIGHPPADSGASGRGPIAAFAGSLLSLAWALLLALRDLNPAGVSQALGDLFMGLPIASLRENQQFTPAAVVSVVVLLPAALLLLLVAGAAIARSSACQFALGKAPGWPEALGYALARWRALLGATLGPLLVIWLLMALTAGVGRALFAVPVVNTVAAALLPLAMLVCLLAAVLCGAYAFGHTMLVPAVAADDADAFDAVQRAYAYTLARPGRLLLYVGLMIGVGLVAALGVRAMLMLAIGLTQATTGAPIDAPASVLQSADADDWLRRSASIATFWARVVGLVGAAYMVSFYFTAGTLVYLGMRHVCDRQDMAEVWQPRGGGEGAA